MRIRAKRWLYLGTCLLTMLMMTDPVLASSVAWGTFTGGSGAGANDVISTANSQALVVSSSTSLLSSGHHVAAGAGNTGLSISVDSTSVVQTSYASGAVIDGTAAGSQISTITNAGTITNSNTATLARVIDISGLTGSSSTVINNSKDIYASATSLGTTTINLSDQNASSGDTISTTINNQSGGFIRSYDKSGVSTTLALTASQAGTTYAVNNTGTGRISVLTTSNTAAVASNVVMDASAMSAGSLSITNSGSAIIDGAMNLAGTGTSAISYTQSGSAQTNSSITGGSGQLTVNVSGGTIGYNSSYSTSGYNLGTGTTAIDLGTNAASSLTMTGGAIGRSGSSGDGTLLNVRMQGQTTTGVVLQGGTIYGDLFDNSGGSKGIVTASGGVTSTVGTVGAGGATGALTVTGSSSKLTVTGNTFAPASAFIGSSALLELDGSALTTASTIDGLSSGNGTLSINQSGAAVTLGQSVGGTNPLAAVNVSSGSLTTGGNNITSTSHIVGGTINITSGASHSTVSPITLSGSGIVNFNDGSATISPSSGQSITASGTASDAVNINGTVTTSTTGQLGHIGSSGTGNSVGTVAVGNSSTFTVSGTQVYGTNITVASGSTLSVKNAGTLAAGTGGLVVSSGGALVVDTSGTGSSSVTGAVTLNGSATGSLGGGTVASMSTSSGTGTNTLSGGTLSNYSGDGSSTLNMSGGNLTAFSLAGSSTMNASAGAISNGTLTGSTANFVVPSGSTATLSGSISGASSGNGNITLVGNWAPGGSLLNLKKIEIFDSKTLTIANNISATNVYLGSGGSGATMTTNANNLTLTGSVDGSNGFGASKLGTLNVNNSGFVVNGNIGANTPLAHLNLNSGSLDLSGGSYSLAAQQVSIGSGATLTMGSGSLTGSVDGASSGVGNLTFAGSQTLSGAIGSVNPLANVNISAGKTLTTAHAINTGNITIGSSGGLTLQTGGSLSSTTAVSVGSGATLDASGAGSQSFSTLSGGGTVALGANSLSASNATNTTFSGLIADGGVSGGSGASFTKAGIGTLTLSGANTYTGTTTVSAGTLALSGGGAISSSSSLVNNGTLDISATTSGATIPTLSGSGTVALGAQTLTVNQGANQTYSGVMSGTGSLTKAGTSSLTLSNTNTYTGGTTISGGTLALSGTGGISSSSGVQNNGTFDISATTAGATINTLSGSGTVVLGAQPLTIVHEATNTFSGTMSGSGNMEKTGNGILYLTGNNNITGNITVSAGTLSVNGSTSAPIMVKNGAQLKGTGQVNNTVTVASGGTLAPGNSIGTITVANLNLESGSSTSFDLSPTANSQIITKGALNVKGPSTVVVVPEAGNYSSSKTYTLITFDSQTGASDNLTVTNPNHLLQSLSLDVTSNSVVLALETSTPSDHVLPGNNNAAAVADAITEIMEKNSGQAGLAASPFNTMLSQLFNLSEADFNLALNQMHPALLKGLTVSQQSNILGVSESLRSRMQLELDRVPCSELSSGCQDDKNMTRLWVRGYGDTLKQRSMEFEGSPELGYKNKMAGLTVGSDVHFAKVFYAGALAAFTGSNLHWNEGQGTGNLQSGYAGAYVSAIGDLFYANMSLINGWNYYQAHRNIIYPGVNARADSRHRGHQFLSHFDTGVNWEMGVGENWGVKGIAIRPFESFDYLTQSENGFTESGAGAYNLSISKSEADLVRNELGVHFAGSIDLSSSRWSIGPKVSWVREVRPGGQEYTVEFEGTGVPFSVVGYAPNRSLLGLGALLSGQMLEDLLTVNLYYNAELGAKAFSNSSYGAGLQYSF